MGRKAAHNQNKKEERIILKYFTFFYPDFPKGKITESESPDFFISPGPKRKIGLELTRLTRSDSVNHKHKHNIVQVDSLEKNICEKARKTFESKLRIPIYADIFFKEGISLSKLSADKYAELIALDIYDRFFEIDLKSNFQFEINNPSAADIIHYITITYFPGVKTAYWNNSGAYLLPELTRELLQRIIATKEEKLPLYQKNLFDEYWLLIYSDSVRKSSAFNISNQVEKWNLASGFDRVFLFEVVGFRIYEIV